MLERGGIPFVIGGGNDESYPNACGLLNIAALCVCAAIFSYMSVLFLCFVTKSLIATQKGQMLVVLSSSG